MSMYMCDFYYQTCPFTAVTLSLLCANTISTLHRKITLLCNIVLSNVYVTFKWEILYFLVNVVATKLNMM